MTLDELLKLRALKEVALWLGLPLNPSGDCTLDHIHGRRTLLYTAYNSVQVACIDRDFNKFGDSTEYCLDTSKPAQFRAVVRWLYTGDLVHLENYREDRV